ncbi:glycosyl transferase group 1 [Thermaerobacter marianensis DSM 12885]|uniref:Glycosyl transferase group 1 n=1 Tax=Thermaerobacter marianensis (strain ATCC 700841 / DSM 12885 / JCM 10246 / 7p75a) TaxID=644966 RepID=E6SHS1_THEM7|nr:glycosyltransferase family 4 protein [Thermaerobacter marianensis]ADU50768.1 glycosyl transferase group 1 [Thermaerobacter marianensis DSM 12885]
MRGPAPSGRPERLQVWMLPDYSEGNPYQRLLADALADLGVRVSLAKRLADVPPPAGPGRPGDGPDVIHLHWTHGYMLDRWAWMTAVKGTRLVGWLAAMRRRGAAIVWTVHNLHDHDRRQPRLERFFHRRLVRLCDALIVHCRYARDAVAGAFAVPEPLRRRTFVMPHGHYVGVYGDVPSRDEARYRLGLERDAVVFLYLGAIRPYKGVPHLVRTFRRLDQAAVRLVVAGRPATEALRAEIEAAAQSDPRIRLFLQHVPDDDVPIFMGAADAVVMPYEDIFTSGTVILAMSHGRPVIAPRRGCLAEVVDAEGGFLYPPADPAGLEQALRHALACRDQLPAMGRHNRERVAAWTWQAVALETKRAYQAAVAARHARAGGEGPVG